MHLDLVEIFADILGKRARAKSSFILKSTSGGDAQFLLVKRCLTFLTTQPNVQARWRSLLEKLIIELFVDPLWAGRIPCDATSRLSL